MTSRGRPTKRNTAPAGRNRIRRANQHQHLSSEDRELEVLLTEYEAGREDNRHNLTQQSALIVAAVTALGALLVVAGLDQIGALEQVLLSGVALAIGTYIAVYFAAANARYRYHQAIEAEIAGRVKIDIGRHVTPEPYPAPVLHAPALAAIERAINSPRRANRVVWLSGLLLVLILVVPGVTVYLLAPDAGRGLAGWYVRRVILFFDILYFVFLSWIVWTTVVSPHRFIVMILGRVAVDRRAKDDIAANKRSTATSPATSYRHAQKPRSITSYLLWPRLPESFKSIYYLLACLLGFAIYQPRPYVLIVALIFWVALEPLAYQARYAWNDLRDADDDQQHPVAKQRRRLPWGSTSEEGSMNLRAVAVMVFIRMALSFAVVVWFIEPVHVRTVSLLILAALIAQATAYEAARLVTKKPNRANLSSPKLAEYHVYILVGIGYGLRAAAGLWFGSGYMAAPTILTWTFLFLTFLGMANVMTVWLLEGSTLNEPAKAGGTSTIRKSHVSSLWNFHQSKPGCAIGVQQSPGLTPWLKHQDRLWSPWFGAYAIAAAAAGITGVVLWDTAATRWDGLLPEHGNWSLCAVAAVVAIGVMAVLAGRSTTTGWYLGLGIPLIIAVIIAIHRSDATTVLAVTPFTLLMIIYLGTRSSSYEAITEGIVALANQLGAAIYAGWLRTLKWVLGSTVFALFVSQDKQEKARGRKE